MNILTISKKYPTEQYNLLGNTDVMVEIPDSKLTTIHKKVMFIFNKKNIKIKMECIQQNMLLQKMV